MKRRIALLLALVMVLALWGCEPRSVAELTAQKYKDMVYTRPDLDELNRILETSCGIALEGESINKVEDAIWDFYDVYDSYYTNYYLAYLGYCHDVTDIYWQEEYQFCADNYATVDAGLETLYEALADSPMREQLETDEYFGEGYFDDYEGESFYDETVMDLLNRENELTNQYYDLYSQSMEAEYYSDAYFDTYAEPMCQILVDLVQVRREMSEYLGYPDYASFCYDCYYYRDYSWQSAEDYLQQIGQELVELYRQVNDSDMWNAGYAGCTEKETYAYLRQTVESMGGTLAEAFRLLDAAELYDIGYGENKYNASFEVYLDSYYEPFIFMNPTQTQWDKLSLVHEFGHFANDYVAYGSYAGNDVEEVFSQGLEYLSLCYVEDENLERLKMADCLSTYVEQAAYASFEHRLYTIPEEELTTDAVFTLYKELGESYAFDAMDWDPRDVVTVTHFYTDPMYIVSYVVSNDAAFQLYQLEKHQSGSGLELYESQLGTNEAYFLAFVEGMGLESPFESDRITNVRRTLEAILGEK